MCVAPETSDFADTVHSLQHYTEHINNGEASAILYLKRGTAYQQLRALEAALKDYDRALAFDPPLDRISQATVQDNRNTCLRQLSRYSEAIDAGREATRLAPDTARYHTNLGFVLYWSGDYDAALKSLERALGLDKDEAWAYGYRGMIYSLTGRPELAIKDFNIVIGTGSAMSMLYSWRAQTYLQLGNYEAAETDSNTGIERSEHDDWHLWALRGWARYEQDKLADALGDFNESIAMHPDHYAYLGRALIYRVLGADDAAEIDTDKFVQSHPQGAIAALQEAAYHLQKGNRVLA